MIKAGVSVTGADEAMRSVMTHIKKLQGRNQVLVGVQKGEGAYEDGSQVAVIAAANHFGATIKSAGGVSYGYKTRKDAENGQVRFLEKGAGFMELGKTGAGVIKIPPRPFLDAAITKNQKQYSKIFERSLPEVLDGKLSTEDVLSRVGEAASGHVQQYMIELRDPPNAASTIRKKKSDNPLNDTGFLRQSIRHQVATESVTEGV